MSDRVSDEVLAEWAKHRADDAGRLARELIEYRRGNSVLVPKVMNSEQLAAATKAWGQLDFHTATAVMMDKLYQAFLSHSKAK